MLQKVFDNPKAPFKLSSENQCSTKIINNNLYESHDNAESCHQFPSNTRNDHIIYVNKTSIQTNHDKTINTKNENQQLSYNILPSQKDSTKNKIMSNVDNSLHDKPNESNNNSGILLPNPYPKKKSKFAKRSNDTSTINKERQNTKSNSINENMKTIQRDKIQNEYTTPPIGVSYSFGGNIGEIEKLYGPDNTKNQKISSTNNSNDNKVNASDNDITHRLENSVKKNDDTCIINPNEFQDYNRKFRGKSLAERIECIGVQIENSIISSFEDNLMKIKDTLLSQKKPKQKIFEIHIEGGNINQDDNLNEQHNHSIDTNENLQNVSTQTTAKLNITPMTRHNHQRTINSIKINETIQSPHDKSQRFTQCKFDEKNYNIVNSNQPSESNTIQDNNQINSQRNERYTYNHGVNLSKIYGNRSNIKQKHYDTITKSKIHPSDHEFSSIISENNLIDFNVTPNHFSVNASNQNNENNSQNDGNLHLAEQKYNVLISSEKLNSNQNIDKKSRNSSSPIYFHPNIRRFSQICSEKALSITNDPSSIIQNDYNNNYTNYAQLTKYSNSNNKSCINIIKDDQNYKRINDAIRNIHRENHKTIPSRTALAKGSKGDEQQISTERDRYLNTLNTSFRYIEVPEFRGYVSSAKKTSTFRKLDGYINSEETEKKSKTDQISSLESNRSMKDITEIENLQTFHKYKDRDVQAEKIKLDYFSGPNIPLLMPTNIKKSFDDVYEYKLNLGNEDKEQVDFIDSIDQRPSFNLHDEDYYNFFEYDAPHDRSLNISGNTNNYAPSQINNSQNMNQFQNYSGLNTFKEEGRVKSPIRYHRNMKTELKLYTKEDIKNMLTKCMKLINQNEIQLALQILLDANQNWQFRIDDSYYIYINYLISECYAKVNQDNIAHNYANNTINIIEHTSELTKDPYIFLYYYGLYNLLGGLYYKNLNYEQAIYIYTKMYKILDHSKIHTNGIKTYGTKLFKQLYIIKYQIANCLFFLNQIQQALVYYLNVYEIINLSNNEDCKEFPRNMRLILSCINKIAICCLKLKRYKDSLNYYDMLSKYILSSKPYHELSTVEIRYLAHAYHKMAKIYTHFNDHKNATQCYNNLLKLKLEINGKDYYDITQAYFSLAESLLNDHEYEQAFYNYSIGNNMIKDKIGHNTIQCANCYIIMAQIQYKLKNYQNSIDIYEIALEIYITLLGHYHYFIYRIYLNIFYLSFLISNKTNIQFYQQKLISLLDKDYNVDTRNYTILNEMGNIYRKNKLFNKAIEYYQLAINIFNNGLNNQHYQYIQDKSSLSLMYCNLASTYLLLNNYKDSIKCYKISLDILQDLNGDYIIQQAQIYLNLGKIFSSLKMHNDAMENYNQAYDLYAKINHHEKILEIDYLLKELDKNKQNKNT